MQIIARLVGVLIVGVLTTVAVTLGGCANFGKVSQGGAEMAQTPVTDNPSGKTYPGKFIWHDLITPDLQLAGKFYEELFGWRIEYQQNYAVVRNGDKLIAGILQVEPANGETRQGVWVPTVSVPDVDAATSLVKANGGKILYEPVDMEKRGRAALISDPQRAEMVLLSAKGGDPADVEAAIGDWLWDEIWTEHPENIEQFYKTVLGYDEMTSTGQYAVFMQGGKWRAGMRQVAEDVDHKMWVPVIRVADPAATVQRVEGLGGVVWLTPEEAPGNGDTALIGDATGALLVIQRWPQRSSKGGL